MSVVSAVLLVGALMGSGTSSWYTDPFEGFPPGRTTGTGTEVRGAPDPQRRLVSFLSFVVGDIQRFWRREFRRNGLGYRSAKVVLLRAAVPSGCGVASSATGPFYCPTDGTVYLDVGFFRRLALRLRAPGDFAQAYVIAHEIGHHVQTLAGVTAQVEQARAAAPEEANALSIALELQADCLAGVWGHSTYERGMLERGDLDEALRAAAAVGDDSVQAHTTGRIDPETWTHGSSAQRRAWYLRGFERGDASACDTFSAPA